MTTFLIVVLAALQVADVWLTKSILDKGGRELNPIMRWGMEKIGVMPAMVIPKVIFVAAVAYTGIYWITGVLIAMYVVVVANNSYQLRRR